MPGDAFVGATLNDIATFGNGFVAVGSAPAVGARPFGGIWTSSDGVAWTAAPPAPFGDAIVQVAVAAGDGIIALGTPNAGEGFFESWGTPDARTWSGPVKAPRGEATNATSVVARGPLVVGIGDEIVDVPNGRYNGRVFTTTDGEVWSAVPDVVAMHDARLSAIATRTGGFVIVGSVVVPTGRAAAAWWSSDGNAWTRAADDPSFAKAIMSRVAPGGPGYIAVGSIGPDGAAWTSTDGKTWTRLSDGGAFTGRPLVDIATNGAGFVAIGEDQAGGVALTSSDGTTWVPVPTIAGSAGVKFVSVAVGLKASVVVGKPPSVAPAAGLVWEGPLP